MNLISPVKTICVIDDDKIYIYGLKKLISIKQLTPKLIEFYNGKDAIDFLADPENSEHLPDIIFLDINMPVMDGWAFMENYVKIKPQLGKKITVYMVSSSINHTDIARAKEISDISDYVIKPISSTTLLELFEVAA